MIITHPQPVKFERGDIVQWGCYVGTVHNVNHHSAGVVSHLTGAVVNVPVARLSLRWGIKHRRGYPAVVNHVTVKP